MTSTTSHTPEDQEVLSLCLHRFSLFSLRYEECSETANVSDRENILVFAFQVLLVSVFQEKRDKRKSVWSQVKLSLVDNIEGKSFPPSKRRSIFEYQEEVLSSYTPRVFFLHLFRLSSLSLSFLYIQK